MSALPMGRRSPGVVALLGGALVALGAVLPWMSLFAGLDSYSGLIGLYGRIVLAGGALIVVGGVLLFVRSDWLIRGLVGALGVGLAAFAMWLLFGVREILGHLGDHPMLVARPGPGLFVVLAGALVSAAAVVVMPAQRRQMK